MNSFKELAPGVLLYEDVFKNYDEIFNLVMDDALLWSPALIAANRDKQESISDTSPKLNTEIRNCLSIAMPYDVEEIEKLLESNPNDANYIQSIKVHNAIKPTISEVENNYLNYFDINYMTWHSRLELIRYDEGHFFDNHIDSVPGIPRTVSTVYYLNDDYDGGEIYFPRLDLRIKPPANSMLVFPSNYVYNHSAEPVTGGSKIAIASFLA